MNITPRYVPQTKITFNIYVNGMLNVKAKDLKANKEAQISIKNSVLCLKKKLTKW